MRKKGKENKRRRWRECIVGIALKGKFNAGILFSIFSSTIYLYSLGKV